MIPGRGALTIELRDLSADQTIARSRRQDPRAGRGHRDRTQDNDRDRAAGHNAPAGTAAEVQRAIERVASRWTSHASPERRRPRRADDGDLGPMGMIFVPSIGGHQPLAQGADPLARLRERRERAARDGARAGVEVGSVRASRKDEADVNSFSPAVSRIVTDTSQ